jgi:hypothetical protein
VSLLTPRLGIKKPQDSDTFLTSDFDANYDLIDSYPGVFVCTQSTRPSWGTPQAGQLIFCTDTRILYEWTGTAFREPLVSPGSWTVNATLSTSVSPPSGGVSTTTYTVGTFNSSRACAALVVGALNFVPPQAEYDTTVNFVLQINGNDLTTFGANFTKQGVYISSTGISYTTPHTIVGFATTGSNGVNIGSNTMSIKVNIADNDVYSGGPTGITLTSASISVLAVNNSSQ